MIDSHCKNTHARRIFNGIAHDYERPARVLSYFQYDRWRRLLISQLDLHPQDSVLDVCTGTGLVATDIAMRKGCRVVGLDLSDRMIGQAQRNVQALHLAPLVDLVRGRAESLPFPDGSFDAVVFTFLLRYVPDPQATLRELSRVLRPGGQIVSLEFFVPRNPVFHAFWFLHTRLVLPLGARFFSPQWREVGSFLGPSISSFYREYPLEELNKMWVGAGIGNVSSRVLSLGSAVVMYGRKGANGDY